MREARVIGQLGTHPNIVTIYDLGEHEDQPYIIAEYMDGGDVETLIDKVSNNRVPL